MSSDYILKLKREVETESQSVFGTLDPKLKSCLDDLIEVSNTFKKLLQSNMEQAANTVIPKVRTLLDPFSMIIYEINGKIFLMQRHFITIVRCRVFREGSE